MDWSNESYVRLYVRDTPDWKVLPWQSKALFPLLLRKVDLSGVLETRHGARGVAAIVELPIDVVEAGLAGLLEDGSVQETPTGYVMPNYIAAQTANKSDKLRQRELRQRRAERALRSVTPRDASVTPRDARVTDDNGESHGATNGHAESLSALLCSAERSEEAPSRAHARVAQSDPPTASLHVERTQRQQLALDLWNEQESLRRQIKSEGIDAQARSLMLAPDVEREILARIDEAIALGRTLEDIRADGMHALSVYAAEARAKRTLRYFDGNQWRADRFRAALARTTDSVAADPMRPLRAVPPGRSLEDEDPILFENGKPTSAWGRQ